MRVRRSTSIPDENRLTRDERISTPRCLSRQASALANAPPPGVKLVAGVAQVALETEPQGQLR